MTHLVKAPFISFDIPGKSEESEDVSSLSDVEKTAVARSIGVH